MPRKKKNEVEAEAIQTVVEGMEPTTATREKCTTRKTAAKNVSTAEATDATKKTATRKTSSKPKASDTSEKEASAKKPATRKTSSKPKASDTTQNDSTTKKATNKKKGGQELVEVATRGAWSEPAKSIHSNKLYIEIELLEPALGTTPGDENLLDSFIAKNAPDAASRQEEIEALGETEVAKKQTTVFMKGYFVPSENGEQLRDPLDRYSGVVPFNKETAVYTPFIWNYQLRGMFKDSCGLLAKAKYGESAGMTAYKKRIDGNIMVYPRRVALQLPESYLDNEYNEIPCDPKNLKIVQRPLRASTPQGERVSIASSEEVPAGTRLKFIIEYLNPDDRDAIIEWLNYGSIHGIGAWRNSGRGTFRWRELNSDFSAIID